MPVLKVWDSGRKKKKCIMVPEVTLDSVREKAQIKLGVACENIVLEVDGTDVDDDDILQEFKASTLMILGKGEQWTPASIQHMEEAATPSKIQESPVSSETMMATEVVDKSTNEDNGKADDLASSTSRNTLPSGLPAPERMPLPDLSPALHLALMSGEKNATNFNQLLKECEIFYITKYPDLSDSSYYQAIGKKLVAKYKCLAFTGGNNPWSFVVSKLSQRIRTARWKENTKSKRSFSGHGSGHGTAFKLDKRAKFGENCNLNCMLNDEDYEKHLAELKKEWHGNQGEPHIRSLLKATRTRRKEWQTSLKPGKFSPILDKFPCFEEGSFILYEFFAMRDSSDEGRTDISTRMEWVMRIVSDQSMVTFEGTDTTKSLKLIQNLENLVAKKKGKGQRSKSMLKVVRGIERVDQIKEKQLESEEQEAPKLVVFLDEMDNTLAIYVVGDK